MKVLFLTNEYPPYTYGGAGVHVDYLSKALSKSMDVEVRCFGDQDVSADHLRVIGFEADTKKYTCPKSLQPIFGSAQRAVDWNTLNIDADIVHCHTWYSHLGGIFAKLNYGLPLVVTVHSLEPLRPWKKEQLGNGYQYSLWIEKTALEMADAIIAVSQETKADIIRFFKVDPDKIHIIYNGVDPDEYQLEGNALANPDVFQKYGIDPKQPYVLFVGRIARQKGIIHLVNAIQYLDPGFQVVLAAGAPDTPEIAQEMTAAVKKAQAHRPNVFWLDQTLDKASIIELYANAAVFCCPSIYEPFGIINLEAMACETPVVASAVGGIKEVVIPNETGLLVPLEQMKESPFEALNPRQFAKDLAQSINHLMANPELRAQMAKAGRKRAVEHFSWRSIAAQTKALYESLLK